MHIYSFVSCFCAFSFDSTDTEAELNLIKSLAENDGAFACVICNHFSQGSKGATELAKAVVAASEVQADFKFLYDLKVSIDFDFPYFCCA